MRVHSGSPILYDAQWYHSTHSSIGRRKCWEEAIYPGMKKALIHSLQVTQGEIEHRKVRHAANLKLWKLEFGLVRVWIL